VSSQLLPIAIGIGATFAITAVILSGIHVALGLMGLGLIGVHFLLPRTIIGDAAYQGWIAIDNTTLVAVVLYVLMGELIQRSSLGERAFSCLEKLLSGIPGGLLHSTIGFSGLFAAVSGSSVASAALLGTVTVPPMKERGYDRQMMYGAVAGGGTLGILIPPSIIMVLYGYLGGVSIAALFIAGIVPGLLLIIAFCAYIAVRILLNPALAGTTTGSVYNLRQRLVSLLDIVPLIFIGGIVMIGIYAGIWTPTEAAAGGCVATIAATAAMRELRWGIIVRAMYSTLITSSMILIILVGSSLIAYIANFMHVPTTLLSLIRDAELGPYQILFFCCLIFFVLGCFVDGLSIAIITVPIVLPIMTSLGFDPVWFGVVFTILIEISLITPPFGMNLFVLNGVVEQSRFSDIVMGSVPYFIILLGMITVLAFIPEIALWLPRQLQ
jgi:C4-dicarboxylate transporter, DctM subunit